MTSKQRLPNPDGFQESTTAMLTGFMSSAHSKMLEAAAHWLEANELGTVRGASPATSWAKGSRLHVVSDFEIRFLFYFDSESKICGVWTMPERQQIYRNPDSPKRSGQ